jgi:hypothetical protein
MTTHTALHNPDANRCIHAGTKIMRHGIESTNARSHNNRGPGGLSASPCCPTEGGLSAPAADHSFIEWSLPAQMRGRGETPTAPARPMRTRLHRSPRPPRRRDTRVTCTLAPARTGNAASEPSHGRRAWFRTLRVRVVAEFSRSTHILIGCAIGPPSETPSPRALTIPALAVSGLFRG